MSQPGCGRCSALVHEAVLHPLRQPPCSLLLLYGPRRALVHKAFFSSLHPAIIEELVDGQFHLDSQFRHPSHWQPRHTAQRTVCTSCGPANSSYLYSTQRLNRHPNLCRYPLLITPGFPFVSPTVLAFSNGSVTHFIPNRRSVPIQPLGG